MLERVVGLVALAVHHGLHFAMNGDHRVAETIELGLRLAFGRLDHECAGDGERHGRRVVAVIHEALGGVVDFEPVFFPAAQVHDALVGDEAGGAAIEDGEKRIEALGDVVGVEDGDLGGGGETGRAHHANIHPRDNEDGGGAERSRRDGSVQLRVER